MLLSGKITVLVRLRITGFKQAKKAGQKGLCLPCKILDQIAPGFVEHPEKVNLSPFKFQPRPDEYEKGEYNHINQWETIDSLLCVTDRKNYVNTAKDELKKRDLTVYEISTSYTPTNADNPQIGSSLYFQYGIDGKVLRIILRIKTLSKTSEVFFH